MTESLLSLQRIEAVAWVTLNRPQKLNTLTPAMLDELEQVSRQIDRDNEIRVVVLTGSGERAFCVGADINEWAALTPLDMWRRWVKRGHEVFDGWVRLRQPVIAALNGAAIGGGLELALTADIRLAADSATFSLPEASIGTCPGWSGSQRLTRLIGASRAKYLGLSGQKINAQQALLFGLVHEVITGDQLAARAQSLAQEMATRSPVALQLTKQLLNAAAGDAQEMTVEALAGALAATTEDAREGINSFREKRLPNFVGK